MPEQRASAETDWIRTEDRLPADGQTVWILDSLGKVHQLKYSRRLWWFPDMSMYVYYVPTFWKPIAPSP